MRLAVDDQISSFALAREAGIGHVNRELFDRLAGCSRETDDVIWYANVRSKGAAPGLRLRRTVWPTGSSVVRVAWQQLALPFLLRWDRADVLLATAFVTPVLSFVPSVLIVHDLHFLKRPKDYRGGVRARYLAWMTRLSCRRAGRIVCSSEATRRDLLELVPGLFDSRVSVCHLGFDAQGWEAELARIPPGSARRRPFVLFTGTVEPKKNVSFLLDLFEGDEWLRQTFDLLVVGRSGWGSEGLERRMEDSPWVVRPGFLGREELLAAYRDASCLALPSLGEGFGYPVLEAMASGCPVLASDRGSLPEVCCDAARVLPLDEHVWLDAVRAVHQNGPEMMALLEAGRRRAREFPWARYAGHLWERARQVHDPKS